MESRFGLFPLVLLMVAVLGASAWLQHLEGQDEIPQLKDNVCPDHRYTCRRDQTCCNLGSGRFGCCVYADATCCPDLRSCCPHGYSCNSTSHTCYRNRDPKIKNPIIPIQLPKMTPNTTIEDYSNELTSGLSWGEKQLCPDQVQSCPKSYTCCKQASGSFGCCPLTDAICCEDGVHCCPAGTRCNSTQRRCE